MSDNTRTFAIRDSNGEVVIGHRMIDPLGAAPEGYEWGPMGVLLKINDDKTCCCGGGYRGSCVIHGVTK